MFRQTNDEPQLTPREQALQTRVEHLEEQLALAEDELANFQKAFEITQDVVVKLTNR